MSFPIVIFLLSSLLCPTKSTNAITFDLVHKHSLMSQTRHYDRLTSSLQHVNRLMNTSGGSYASPAITVLPGDGDYLMKISIGTPPVDIYAALETRSDLMWTQCKSCIVCFDQINGPHYDPSNSSTYAPLPCDSPLCYPSLHDAGSTFSSLATACSNGSCFYFQREGSFLTDGVLATDRVTLGDTVTLPNATFGCGMFNANGVAGANNNASVFASGSVGLGPGPTSIVSTVYEYSLSTSFSYCLSPPFVNNGTSKIVFGVDHESQRNGTKSTSMWFSAPYSDYRFVLSAISIGNETVVLSQDNQTVLNMIMDVGTPLTYLPVNFYEQVALEVESQTKHLPRAADPQAMLGLCYNVSKASDYVMFDVDVPEITLRLGLDGDVATSLKLKAANVFVKTANDVACLAFVPTRSAATGVYGNLAQMGFLVTYDLGQSMLSFKEVDCSSI